MPVGLVLTISGYAQPFNSLPVCIIAQEIFFLLPRINLSSVTPSWQKLCRHVRCKSPSSCISSWSFLLGLDFLPWTTMFSLPVQANPVGTLVLGCGKGIQCRGWGHDVGCRSVKLQREAVWDWRKVIVTTLTTTSFSILPTVILEGGNWTDQWIHMNLKWMQCIS